MALEDLDMMHSALLLGCDLCVPVRATVRSQSLEEYTLAGSMELVVTFDPEVRHRMLVLSNCHSTFRFESSSICFNLR